MLTIFANWAHGTAIGRAANGGVPWIWPACETLHFVGLALLVGTVGVLDLRLLGIAKGLGVRPLQRLVRWGVAGFVLNLVTGFVFFAGDPYQYIRNGAFAFKLLFIGLAGVNVLVYYVSGLAHRVDQLGDNDEAPAPAKIVAVISLFLWLGVIFWGRMLPFIGNSF